VIPDPGSDRQLVLPTTTERECSCEIWPHSSGSPFSRSPWEPRQPPKRRVSAALADGYVLHGSPAATFDGEHVIGVFGQVSDIVEEPHPHPELHLTPRQSEVLELLERGRSTSQIAEELHLSTETVRNHISRLLRAIGAHSRLEAVAIANRAH